MNRMEQVMEASLQSTVVHWESKRFKSFLGQSLQMIRQMMSLNSEAIRHLPYAVLG